MVNDTRSTLVLERYRLLDQLAVGGTARVYRARDEQLDRHVAVKLLHPHILPDDTSRRRMAAEARAAAGLSHPGIATVFDVDTDPEAPAIVMELVDGPPLSDRLLEGPMPPRDVARLGADVADALFHAHRRGIVHRDVKPGNILVERRSGRARLVDFGIAHSLAAGAESLTQTGTALGTPRYMAPEQMAGGKVGPRTDLWSLGVVLHQALTGQVPFDGATPLAIAEQQRSGPPPMPGVDEPLASIVAACLSYDMAARPLDAGALATALRAWLDGGLDVTTLTQAGVVPVIPGQPAGDPAETLAAPALAASGASAPAPAEPSPRAPRKILPLVAGAALLAIGLGAAALASGLNPAVADAPPTPTATPVATPDWTATLLADYREACGERLDEAELDGMHREEAEAFVDEEIGKCLEEAEEDDDRPGTGRGPKKDNGNGRGNDDKEDN